MLIGAGILVASGSTPVWLMAPLAYLAVICGVLTGYAWAGRIGPKRVGLNLARFMTGVLPASALWVVTFMGLGLFVGAPVERLLGRFEAYGLRAAVVVIVVLVWVVAARWMPAAKPSTAADPVRGRWRLAVAFGLDLVAVSFAAGTLSLFTKLAGGDSDALTFVAAMFAILGVLYLVVARQTVGYTLGEAVLDVRYHPPRRPRFQRLAR